MTNPASAIPFWELLLDTGILLTVALVLGAAAESVRQSAVVGYLLAGTLVGPGVLGFVHSESEVRTIAELGVALLLFSIGLEFSAGRLKAHGMRPLALGAGQVVATLAIAAVSAGAAGLPLPLAISLAAIITLSSTAVVLRVLGERAELDSVHGRTTLGVLLVQDAAVVPLVVIVSAMAPAAATVPGGAAFDPLARLAVGALALAGLFGFSRLALPRLLRIRTLSRNRELQILFAVAVAIGAASLAHRLGLSASLGAFVAGAILGDSAVSLQVRADVAPLRTLFTTLFFGSVGLLGDPQWIAGHGRWVLLAVVSVILGKVIVVWVLARLAGLSHGHAVATGLCVAQVGEFSFVLAGVARGDGGSSALLDADQFALVVSTTIGTLLLTPSLVAAAPSVGRLVERLFGQAHPFSERRAERLSGHVVVVGFGPAGRAVADAVAEDEGVVVVIDLSLRSIEEAHGRGLAAHLGDATSADLLGEAHVEAARAVVVTLPDHRTALQVIRRVRTLAPGVEIIARARYNVYAGALADAGASAVVDEEAEVGRRLARSVRGLPRGE